MRLKLPSGLQVKICVIYHPRIPDRHGRERLYKNDTLIQIYDTNGLLLGEGRSRCHKTDKFDKTGGRRQAFKHLFQNTSAAFIAPSWDKVDRRAVFEHLFARYRSK